MSCEHAPGSMSNKRARCDSIDFRIQLQEGSDRIELELPRSTPLTADQRPRVLSVRVLGDTVPADFFKGCDALADVEMGTKLARIGDGAFQGCARLKAVWPPDTVAEVGPYAFYVCRGLESVRLPARMRRIPSGMFARCPELRRVTFPRGPRGDRIVCTAASSTGPPHARSSWICTSRGRPARRRAA
jgi:hypothetical protein